MCTVNMIIVKFSCMSCFFYLDPIICRIKQKSCDHQGTTDKMAFAIPAVAAVGVGVAAVTGVSIGGTALGLALTLRDRMKHTTTSITHLMNLTEGDHISLKRKKNQPFRHAIVVEPVHAPKDRIKVFTSISFYLVCHLYVE